MDWRLPREPTDLELSNAVNECKSRGFLPDGLHYRIVRNRYGRKGVEVWSDVQPRRTWICPLELLQSAHLTQKLGGRRIES